MVPPGDMAVIEGDGRAYAFKTLGFNMLGGGRFFEILRLCVIFSVISSDGEAVCFSGEGGAAWGFSGGAAAVVVCTGLPIKSTEYKEDGGAEGFATARKISAESANAK